MDHCYYTFSCSLLWLVYYSCGIGLLLGFSFVGMECGWTGPGGITELWGGELVSRCACIRAQLFRSSRNVSY